MGRKAIPKTDFPAIQGDQFRQRADEIFALSTATELHFTSDGSAFISRNFAEIHARTQKNGTIETIKKKEKNVTKNQD